MLRMVVLDVMNEIVDFRPTPDKIEPTAGHAGPTRSQCLIPESPITCSPEAGKRTLMHDDRI